jgi:1A family penicillin-binding protein
MAGKKKIKKHRVFWLLVKLQMVLFVVVLGALGWYFFGGYAAEVEAMKSEAYSFVKSSSPELFRGNQTSIVYAADGSEISRLKSEKEAYYLTWDEIPTEAKLAIVSIEDKKFYRHNGVDYRAILRALKAMIENGEVTQGGSTITMQLARNTFLTQERTWQRKVEEIFIAWDLEEKYSKEQILEFYLNNIYFGNGYYGLASASRGYFNREVGELDLSQIAFLCAIPNNPTQYDPFTNMDNTLSRRDRILSGMLSDGKITENSCNSAMAERIVLEQPPELQKNNYVETYAYYCATRGLMEQAGFRFQTEFDSDEQETLYNQEYQEMYESCQKKLYTGGYQVYTSIDLELQSELQTVVDETLEGFTEVNEEGIYALQASAVCIDNDNGYVKAIVGGRNQDYPGYTLNRAYQSYRQPGSAIKPLIVYTPILEQNYTPDSLVVDEPIEDGPENASGSYAGEVTLRYAVEHSINTIAWKLYEELTPEKGLSYLQEMNFARLDKEDYRLASGLGGFTNGVSALEMASAYETLENDGKYRAPTCVIRILDADGNEIYKSDMEEKEIYRQNAARMMTDMLKGVFTNGTAKGLGLTSMPCAGKTGTSNDSKDGWFVGYTRYYTTAVWVGYDMPRKMDGLMGNTYPGKIWQRFMETANEGKDILDFLPYAKLSDEFYEQYAPVQEEDQEEPTGEEQSPSKEQTELTGEGQEQSEGPTGEGQEQSEGPTGEGQEQSEGQTDN